MEKLNFFATKKIRLIALLSNNITSYKYSAIEKALRKKDVCVNGQRVKENVWLNEFDEVSIYLNEKDKLNLFDVFYEDQNIIVFNKQKGIEVCNGEFNIQSEYQKTFNKTIYPIHRLDRNTFGLVVFAKTESVEKELVESFKNHNVTKCYYALVYGQPKQNAKTLKSYLIKDEKTSTVKIFDTKQSGASYIETKYQVLKNFQLSTLLSVEITAGKTHQIRAHLAYFNMPIVGDEKYGDTKTNKIFKTKTQMLQAYMIKFNLPKSSNLYYLNKITLNLPCEIKENL